MIISSDERLMARRCARLVRQSGGAGLRRADLAQAMGITETELRGYVGLAWSWRLVDCVRDFVVAPPVKRQAPPLCWGCQRPGYPPSPADGFLGSRVAKTRSAAPGAPPVRGLRHV